MFEIKIKIETPAKNVIDGMWVQIYKAFDANGVRSHEIILDSDKELSCFIDENETIRIDCSVTLDDAYGFSKLQVNGQDVRTGEVLTVVQNLEIFAKSDYIKYKLYNNVKNCIVKRNGMILQNNEILHYGDILRVEYTGKEIVVNRKTNKTSPIELFVYSDVVINNKLIN